MTENNVEQGEMLRGEEAPRWEARPLRVVCAEGPKEVPALAHPWCPGLAVTMTNFGLFSVTHVASGARICGDFERSSTAELMMVRWASVGHAYGFTWEEKDRGKLALALTTCGDRPVPFGGATSTGGAGTRPLTVAEWRDLMRMVHYRDEFPCEDVHPGALARDILLTLAPATLAGA